MAGWTTLWALLAAAAAFTGFGGVDGLEAAVAQILFFITMSALLVSVALVSTRHPQR